MSISQTAVEKDYWVTQLLRILASEFTDDFILKGGTSLSKGYDLIQRFSEDVDVLVIPRERGRGATDTLMKGMSDAAAAGIGGTAESVGGAETGRHRSYEVHYPSIHGGTGLIQPRVLLEMGVRGGDQPRTTVSVGSLLGAALLEAEVDIDSFLDLRPFDLAVLHPGRTLLEKLVLVHVEAQHLMSDSDLLPNARIGRHFYDIHQLLDNSVVHELIDDRKQVDEILDEISKITHQFFAKGDEEIEVSPTDGFASSVAFENGAEVSQRMRGAYDRTMPELYFGTTPLPDWDAICERVRSSRV